MPMPPHEPTDQMRVTAKTLSGLGVPHEDICHILSISKPTLHKYYREELDKGHAEANAKVAQSLFQQATSGNTTAMIFWLKARAGWREKQEIDHTHDVTLRLAKDHRDAIVQAAIRSRT
jgi:hypothetical protein